MLSKQNEDLLRVAVSAFVKNLNGFYRKHCSDEMLVALIMQRLYSDLVYPTADILSDCVGEAVISGRGRSEEEAYLSVLTIFETVLEHGCQAGGNGHHMAQEFARTMMETFGKKA